MKVVGKVLKPNSRRNNKSFREEKKQTIPTLEPNDYATNIPLNNSNINDKIINQNNDSRTLIIEDSMASIPFQQSMELGIGENLVEGDDFAA